MLKTSCTVQCSKYKLQVIFYTEAFVVNFEKFRNTTLRPACFRTMLLSVNKNFFYSVGPHCTQPASELIPVDFLMVPTVKLGIYK